ncbi:MAG TPA: YciI family protein, partial [Solirubrobacteraceae bacterium]|nr:YciI family protein [Solirubrobacteraceae bacterium]
GRRASARRPPDTLGAVDFFVYSRAAPGAASVEHERALDEEHWSYMDRFADGMVARGPTLAADRETWTGSVHIVDLPSVDAAREFVEREPYNRAGLYEDHVIRRFENLLGRTMWEFPGEAVEPRFLVIAGSEAGALPSERLIVHGDLLTLDDARPAGVVLALQAPTRDAVDALVGDGEIHDWEFGGRR